MKLTSPIARLALTGKSAPPAGAGALSGSTSLGIDDTIALTGADVLWAARIFFSAAAQTATISTSAGTITLSATGTRQVETATVVAAAGATASGNLALTLTAAAVVGSPRAVSVPLTTARHTTAAKIAEAIAAALNATSQISSHYTAAAVDATVVITRIGGYANDSTLNLAIAAGLGVSVAASSANTTAGSVGVVVDRLGSSGNDMHNNPLPTCAYLRAMLYKNVGAVTPTSIVANSVTLPNLLAGNTFVMAGATEGVGLHATNPVITAGDSAVIDVVVCGEI